MPKISTELSPEEHAALTRWISAAAVAAGIPGRNASQAIHALIKATVTPTRPLSASCLISCAGARDSRCS